MHPAYKRLVGHFSCLCLYLAGHTAAHAHGSHNSNGFPESHSTETSVVKAATLTSEVLESAALRERASELALEDGSSYKFHPDILNELGKAARLQFEEESASLGRGELLAKAEAYFESIPGGRVSADDMEASYRFEMIAKNLHAKMREVYPGLILEKPLRVFNNVGGVYGVMEVYHCSPTEYLALFGSPLEQHGYSGDYRFMDVYDVMVDGEMKSHGVTATDSLVRTYLAQDVSLLKRKERRYYQMSPGSMMIDYGRGFILPAFWQGVIAPALFINQDFRSLGGQIGECLRSMVGQAHAGVLGAR